jgi:acyl carrier protein
VTADPAVAAAPGAAPRDTAAPGAAPRDTAAAPRLPELVELLQAVTGERDSWAARITPATRLDDDLQLESVELAALSEQLQRRYGAGVDLSAYLAGLDLDALIALTVGDLLSFVGGAEPAR